MDEKRIREKIHRAVDVNGASIQADPLLAQRLLAKADRKEAPRMKKLTTGMIIAIVLMLLSVTAVAVGLTVEQLWQQSFEKMNTTGEIPNLSDETEAEITMDEAIAIARAAIIAKYGTPESELDAMGVYPTYAARGWDGKTDDYPSKWEIYFSSRTNADMGAHSWEMDEYGQFTSDYGPTGEYRVYINAETKEITYCHWYTNDFWSRAQTIWDCGSYDEVYWQYKQTEFYTQPIETQKYWEQLLAEKGYELRTSDTEGKELLRSLYLDVIYYERERFLDPAQDAQAAAAWVAVEQIYGYDAALMQKYGCVAVRTALVSETDDLIIGFNHHAAPENDWNSRLERGGQHCGEFLIRFVPGTTEIVSTAHMPYSYWSAVIDQVTEGKLFEKSDWLPEDFLFFDTVYTETEKAMARMTEANAPGLEKSIVLDAMMISLGANPEWHTNVVPGYDVARWFSDEGDHVATYAPTLNREEVEAQYGMSPIFWPLEVQYDLMRQSSIRYTLPREGELTEEEATQIALDAICDKYGADALTALGDYRIGVTLTRYTGDHGKEITHWVFEVTDDPETMENCYQVSFIGENYEDYGSRCIEVYEASDPGYGNG